jgi:uncharacterized membrane protein HdeD (DUF308 family)
MIERIASHWWLFLIRGIVALAIGILVPFYPITALITIALLFGVYAFLDGIFAIVTAVRMNHANNRWIWLTIEGVIGILVGIFAVVQPGITAFTLGLLLGFWAIVTGILALGSAFNARVHVPNEWLWALVGVISIAFGIFVFFVPALGLFALLWTFSIYLLLTGIALIGLALRLRTHTTHQTMHPAS